MIFTEFIDHSNLVSNGISTDLETIPEDLIKALNHLLKK